MPVTDAVALQFLSLETTRRCNLRCIHCAVSEENDPHYRPFDLSLELFERVLPMLRLHRPRVQLSGHGETLLHPSFMQMLDAVIDAGCRVTFQTNGTILKRSQIERFMRPEIEEITISVDGASSAVFDHVRRGARLERVLDNVRYIEDEKRRRGTMRPELVFELVAMRQNVHELPGVVRLAGELGIKRVVVAELKEYALTRGQSLAGSPLMAHFAAHAEREAAKWGIELSLPPHIPGREAEKAAAIVPAERLARKAHAGFRKDCDEPWVSLFVQYDGEVRPCCVITEPYGDLGRESIEEVWHGEKLAALRAALQTDEPPAACVACPLYGWVPLAGEHA